MHILTTGVLLGGHIFQEPATMLSPWLLSSITTGLVLLVIDLHASMSVLCEVRGVLLLIKLALLLLIPLYTELTIPILIVVLVIGAVGSHMSKHHRHKVLLLEKFIVPDQRSG